MKWIVYGAMPRVRILECAIVQTRLHEPSNAFHLQVRFRIEYSSIVIPHELKSEGTVGILFGIFEVSQRFRNLRDGEVIKSILKWRVGQRGNENDRKS